MALAHLICGSTGAGKSTYAKNLAKTNQALVFSIDEWMQNLFWKDTPKPSSYEWAMERVLRCEVQIWQVARNLLDLDHEVILDLGFSTKEQRERFRKLLEATHSSQLHYLDIPADIRWQRVKARNQSQGETFQFEVTRETFDWMEKHFEAPEAEELSEATIVGRYD